MLKINVTVPESHTEYLIKVMADAGAGVIGTYTHCSIITKVEGTFLPQKGSNPYFGEIGKLNREPESKIEMLCPEEKLQEVLKAIGSVHPYETPAIDVIQLYDYKIV